MAQHKPYVIFQIHHKAIGHELLNVIEDNLKVSYI